ncbi:MAG: RIP metalloprotease RseP [Acidobacteria bacterium]|nr:RIP metalloprotease RseP [Acidobacteriota bacterium]
MLHLIGTNVVALIFVLGVMILVHELGHYIVAKLLKIRVEIFSLGFGPRLFGFRKGDTDYRVSALPFGGYVKMAGENPDEELTGSGDEFLSRPKSHRLAVAAAGPLMNILLALVLVTANFMVGVELPAYLHEAPVIGSISPQSPAQRANLQIGDRILSVGGTKTATWQDVEIAIGTSPRKPLAISVERIGQTLTVTVTPEAVSNTEIGAAGIAPHIASIVASVEPNSPAEKAGLKPGDVVIKVKSATMEAFSFPTAAELIAGNEGKPLEFTIRRGQQILVHTIIPVKIRGDVRIGYVRENLPYVTEKFGFVGAIQEALARNYKLTLLTFDVVGKIVTGQASIRAMSGPIEIAKYSGAAARAGVGPLLSFMGLISLQLGIFNMFPIPILDGGVIFLILIEGLLRRDLSLRVKERIFQIGFIFLILLMGIVIFNDLNKSLPIFR